MSIAQMQVETISSFIKHITRKYSDNKFPGSFASHTRIFVWLGIK